MALVTSAGFRAASCHAGSVSIAQRLQSGSHASSSPRCSPPSPTSVRDRRQGTKLQEDFPAAWLRQELFPIKTGTLRQSGGGARARSSNTGSGWQQLPTRAASAGNEPPQEKSSSSPRVAGKTPEQPSPGAPSEARNGRPENGPISALMDTGEKIFWDFEIDSSSGMDGGPAVDEGAALEEEPEESVEDLLAGLDGTTVIDELKEEEDIDRRFKKTSSGREVFYERTFLVGVDQKGAASLGWTVADSLEELAQLADTAGLRVVGTTHQKLEHPNPKTYVGSGKINEIARAVEASGAETVVFDDELSPGQLRNLEKVFGDSVRVCDRTALILDIFSQRAATKEGKLQVEMAQAEYQLPRLTRMWTHLERQSGGGQVKGMGEKQIEVDRRLLKTRITQLRRELESVRDHRQQYRDRRAATPIPVISLVGYTNAGKSTLLNRLSGAGVLAEDQLFATLDPTTRRVNLPNGKETLFTDTVGFIQKLPTQLVAAFRATLEEISEASLLLHVVDVSHPMAGPQVAAVEAVLADLDVGHIPILTVWNKVDRVADPLRVIAQAMARENTVAISALTGYGLPAFLDCVEAMIKDTLVRVEAVVPYRNGDLLDVIHRLGVVESEEYLEEGTLVQAYVPLSLSRKLMPFRSQVQKLEPRV
ncbi:hypothetical protein KFL_005150010 [Klebsormidium nitens]|uniref:Hflx-type G domain-containing protein n=1 Tax=Klebsormidium nitens TaxID=105231 RepID=A0A1Y1IML9_KLENI|nr:hypothetical protein KFL_005150010 [Klebsormidium nitens]|eukprot:GAQ89368.1 hypothetical protein KFL_005150010 [Klebsormidium nitens]